MGMATPVDEILQDPPVPDCASVRRLVRSGVRQAEHHPDHFRRSGVRRLRLHGQQGRPHSESRSAGFPEPRLHPRVCDAGLFAVAGLPAHRKAPSRAWHHRQRSRQGGGSREEGRPLPAGEAVARKFVSPPQGPHRFRLPHVSDRQAVECELFGCRLHLGNDLDRGPAR